MKGGEASQGASYTPRGLGDLRPKCRGRALPALVIISDEKWHRPPACEAA